VKLSVIMQTIIGGIVDENNRRTTDAVRIASPSDDDLTLLQAGLAGDGPAGNAFVPLWAAYPAVGFGGAALPTLRSDAADRLVGRDQPVNWPHAFLHLLAEGARAELRTLDRLEAVAEKGRGLAAAADKRSRLPDAVDALLHAPVLTPKALAARLGIAPQTGTGCSGNWQPRGWCGR
jgi:hypothetical protein